MMVQIIPSVIFGLPSTISEKYNPVILNKGSYISAHDNVLFNLLNKLGKRDQMWGLPNILTFFSQQD